MEKNEIRQRFWHLRNRPMRERGGRAAEERGNICPGHQDHRETVAFLSMSPLPMLMWAAHWPSQSHPNSLFRRQRPRRQTSQSRHTIRYTSYIDERIIAQCLLFSFNRGKRSAMSYVRCAASLSPNTRCSKSALPYSRHCIKRIFSNSAFILII